MTYESLEDNVERAEKSLIQVDWMLEDREYYSAIYSARTYLQSAKGDLSKIVHGKANRSIKEHYRAMVAELELTIKNTRVAYALGLIVAKGYSSSDERLLWTGDGVQYISQEDASLDYTQLFLYPTFKAAERDTTFRDYLQKRLQIPKAKQKWKKNIEIFEVHIVAEPYLSRLRERWLERKVQDGVYC